jgi:hypothetical protein
VTTPLSNEQVGVAGLAVQERTTELAINVCPAAALSLVDTLLVKTFRVWLVSHGPVDVSATTVGGRTRRHRVQ